MQQIIKPPTPLPQTLQRPCLFLAGSIEMGGAEEWQSRLTHSLIQASTGRPLTILNPRRDAWDAGWEQSIDNAPFREQVEWELAAQETADLIAMYFSPRTKAPITLLELGLFARSGKLIVCCPDGFWRKGNVEVVCARYAIPLISTFDAFATTIQHRLSPPLTNF